MIDAGLSPDKVERVKSGKTKKYNHDSKLLWCRLGLIIDVIGQGAEQVCHRYFVNSEKNCIFASEKHDFL